MKRPTPLLLLQHWWLLALLFLIPLSLRYITKDPFAISWLNLISVGFIGLGVINVGLKQLKLYPVTPRSLVLVIAGLLVAMAWALLFTDPIRNGFGLWTSRLLQPLLVGFFAYQLFKNRVTSVSHCIAALYSALLVLCVIGGLQVAGIIPFNSPGRITALYQFPNTFARYVEILLLITLPWILFHIKDRKWLYFGGWILGVLLLLGTKSYGGTGSFFVGLVTFFLLLPNPYVRLKQRAVIGLLLLAAIVAINAPKLPKWETTITDSRLSRLEYWDIALGVISDNFWTGIGIKTWEVHYLDLLQKYGPLAENRFPINWLSPQPHNVFLDSFVKAGLPGFLAITSLLFWPVFRGYKVVQSYSLHKDEWWFGLSMASYGVAMIVFGLADDPIWSDDTMPLLFILYFALAFISNHTNGENGASKP